MRITNGVCPLGIAGVFIVRDFTLNMTSAPLEIRNELSDVIINITNLFPWRMRILLLTV